MKNRIRWWILPLAVSLCQTGPAAQPQRVTGSAPFEVELPRQNGRKVSVAEFGASPDASPRQNAEAFDRALEKVRRTKASVLEIPRGVYRIGAERPSDLLFTDLEDLSVEGDGAELVFGRHAAGKHENYIFFQRCRRVRLSGVTLDWDWADFPLFAIARVAEVNREKAEVILERVHGAIPDAEPLLFGVNREWNPAIGNRSRNEGYTFPAPDRILSRTKTAPDRISVRYKESHDMERVKVGQQIQLSFKPEHGWPSAIGVHDCRHLTFDGITIYSAPYIAVNSLATDYFQIVGSRIEPRPGADRVLSTYGGMEIHQVRGHFRLENCHVEGIGDDNLHLSNHYLGGGLTRIDDRTVYANYLQQWSSKDLLYRGARMQLRDAQFRPRGWSSEIAEYAYEFNVHKSANAHRVKIRFRDPLPADLREDDKLWNEDMFTGNYVIRGNVFRGGLCHALYLGLSNGLVENNRFTNFAYPPLVVNTVLRWDRWFIGNPVSNVIIRGNILTDNNTAQRDPASLFVGAGYDRAPSNYLPVEEPVVRDILIEENRVENSACAAFALFSAENVTVRNNLFLDSNTRPTVQKNYRGMGNVFILRSKEVELTGNRLENRKPCHERGMYTDPFSREGVRMENNRGFDPAEKRD